MAAKPLSEAQLDAAERALLSTGGNIVAAAKVVGINPKTFQNHADTLVRKGRIDLEALRASKREEAREVYAPKASPRLPVTADECWELLDGWIGRKRAEYKHPQKWQAKPE